jgi:hypothetical protein
MLNDELTVFDIKFNEGIDRLNNLLSEQSYTSSIKNYVERYKIDKSLEERNSKLNYTSNRKNSLKDNRRNKVVDLYEIRNHDRKVQQFRNKNYLKNEIEWFKIKEREDEQKNKYNYNKQKYQNDTSDNNKDIIRNNNLKMKKFAIIANKVNIDKFLEKKKINKILNNEKTNKAPEQNNPNNNNYFQDGVFIPYSEYKKYEQIMMNKNRKNNMNLKKINNNLKYNKSYKNVKLNNNISQKKLNLKKNNTNKNINNKRSNNILSYSININNNKIQSASMIKNKNKILNKNSSTKKFDNRYNIDIRKPLEKRIDYLREKPPSLVPKIKIYDSKKIFKDKKDILNNIDSLNYYSKKYETEAKRQEQLMRVRGKKSYGDDDNVKLSNLLIDSISTKLAILNQFTSEKNK